MRDDKSNMFHSPLHPFLSRWSAVGFTHGVLNTDNLSLAGVTIDYGPFGFLDEYNTSFIPNHSDDMGR